MKKTTNLWRLIGFAITSFGGTILHFLYDWTQKSIFVSPFSGVNESTWEHMKLLFWPMLAFSIFESFFMKERSDFWCIKLRGITLGLVLIPVLFYTYNGVVGKSPDWINIVIFFISASCVYIFESKLLNQEKTRCKSPKLAIIILVVIGILFVVFTYFTPEINIFKDPIYGTYGI